ncbi:hypothetical protein STA3757_46740 [Stanieria sp. NIES-3757]|nr:hypothetical protein STA3757_46740 [Stanieria sp. NIES-3757]
MTINFEHLINPVSNLFNRNLSELFTPFEKLRQASSSVKIYDYRRYSFGSDYIFELVNNTNTGYMTGYGMGIKPGDHLLLTINNRVCQYRVQEIDYYANPSDMWIALLKQIIQSK